MANMPGLKRDKITSYRLPKRVVQEFLEGLFGLYDYQIHVRRLDDRLGERLLMFLASKHKNDHWIFHIPQRLDSVRNRSRIESSDSDVANVVFKGGFQDLDSKRDVLEY